MRTREEILIYQKWYRENKRDKRKHNADGRKRHEEVRNKVFTLYGTKCSICNYDEIRGLELDHLNDDGAIERRKYQQKSLYVKILKNEVDLNRYQLLCINCHANKTWGHFSHTSDTSVLKGRLLNALGNECTVCKETRRGVLQIDHIFGNGSQHLKSFGRSVCRMYKNMLIDPERDSKYQVLCALHNRLKFYNNTARQESLELLSDALEVA